MVKLGVIADTHLVKPNETLCRLNSGVFADVDLILHAGDLTRIAVLEAFENKKVVAVAGNMDRRDVTDVLPAKETIEIGGYRIGLIQGWGSPKDLESKIIPCFDNVQAIVYGHTHKAACQTVNGIYMFNPGAFSGTFLWGRRPSVGILIIGDKIEGKIINL